MMGFRASVATALLVMLVSMQSTLAAPKADLWDFWLPINSIPEQQGSTIDHRVWQQILDTYLDANHSSGVNRFNYSAVSVSDKGLLEAYLKALQAIDPRKYPKAEQQAYWINLYNALTVQRILAAYPVSSITKVGGGFFSRGPWDEPAANINGKSLTLNDIEHRILRPIWKDARIHFAVNCASIGCPNLSPAAYTGKNVDGQLEAAAKEYLAHNRSAMFDGNTLVLSKIFDWYQEDFGTSEWAMLKTIAKYAPESKAARIREYSSRVKYDYDWALNE